MDLHEGGEVDHIHLVVVLVKRFGDGLGAGHDVTFEASELWDSARHIA